LPNLLYLCTMINSPKTQAEILAKLGIAALNPMQIEAEKTLQNANDVVLLSPTGTGKTLAFLLPLIASLNADLEEVQLLIIVPSRELALQIEQVIRELGSGFKANVVYGGRSFSQDKIDLKHPPAILVGTPGRIADHLRRRTFSTQNIATLVLDEFDKSLEIGFEGEMKEIVAALHGLKNRVLTSATQGVAIPGFVGLRSPKIIDYTHQGIAELKIVTLVSQKRDKLEILVKLLERLGNQPGIVFCNFKESIDRVSDYLNESGIKHGSFYGGLEQQDRERALIKFRNGTHQLLLATDLAARGLDIPEIKFIIHYHLPLRSEEFTHRNGRTARMHHEGTAYVLKWEKEPLPAFVDENTISDLPNAEHMPVEDWTTVFISGGRRDKISKGDIAGLFLKQGNIAAAQLGSIEIKQDCAFVAVKTEVVNAAVKAVDNSRLKKKKVRISEI